ncbi:hypothetical protein [Ewingella americana]|nr:hypothetical protein [Ewingella americana]
MNNKVDIDIRDLYALESKGYKNDGLLAFIDWAEERVMAGDD